MLKKMFRFITIIIGISILFLLVILIQENILAKKIIEENYQKMSEKLSNLVENCRFQELIILASKNQITQEQKELLKNKFVRLVESSYYPDSPLIIYDAEKQRLHSLNGNLYIHKEKIKKTLTNINNSEPQDTNSDIVRQTTLKLNNENYILAIASYKSWGLVFASFKNRRNLLKNIQGIFPSLMLIFALYFVILSVVIYFAINKLFKTREIALINQSTIEARIKNELNITTNLLEQERTKLSLLEKELRGLENQVNDLEKEIVDKNKIMSDKNKLIDMQNAEIDRLKDRLEAKKYEIIKKEDEFKTKKEELERANEELWNKNEALIDLTDQITEQNSQINKIRKESEKKNQELEKANEELWDKNNALIDLTDQITEQNSQINKIRKELEKKNIEMEEANIRIKSASESKSKFMANISHEIRTPINAINGLASQLIFGFFEKDEELTLLLEKAIGILKTFVSRTQKDKEAIQTLVNKYELMLKVILEGRVLEEYLCEDFDYVIEKLPQKRNRDIKSKLDLKSLNVEMFNLIQKQEEETIQAYRYIKSGGEYLLNLINMILNFSKVDAGKLDINFSPVHIRQLISSIMVDVFHYAKSKNKDEKLTLEHSISEDVPEIIILDKMYIKQILLNLLSNAVKFSDEGLINLQISKKNDDIHFVVSDEGIGIKEDELRKLFKEFGRTDSAKDIEGTGLGLAFSKLLVEKHGGTISVESEFGKGSTFGFSIPLNIRQNG